MKRIFVDSIPGALLSLWIVLHLWLVHIFVVSAMVLANDVLINEINSAVQRAFHYIFNLHILNLSGIEIFGITIAIIIGGMFLSVVWFYLYRKYKFDPHHFSSESIKWTLRVISRPTIILSFLIPLAVAVYAYNINNFWLMMFPIIIAGLLSVFVLPFSILRDAVLRSNSGESWWFPKWPGIWAVMSFLLLFVLILLITIAFEILSIIIGDSWLFVLLLILYACIAALYVPTMAAILIHKLSPKAAIRRTKDVLKWSIFGPLLSLQVKLIYFAMFIAVPIMSLGVLFIFVFPTYSKWLTDHGFDLPKYIKFAISCKKFVIQTGYYGAFLVPIAFISLLFSGRLVWLLNHQISGEQLSNQR